MLADVQSEGLANGEKFPETGLQQVVFHADSLRLERITLRSFLFWISLRSVAVTLYIYTTWLGCDTLFRLVGFNGCHDSDLLGSVHLRHHTCLEVLILNYFLTRWFLCEFHHTESIFPGMFHPVCINGRLPRCRTITYIRLEHLFPSDDHAYWD